jgi:signal transduction histidine kinase
VAHGGRIWAQNREGGGARFSFAVPTPPPPRDAAP